MRNLCYEERQFLFYNCSQIEHNHILNKRAEGFTLTYWVLRPSFYTMLPASINNLQTLQKFISNPVSNVHLTGVALSVYIIPVLIPDLYCQCQTSIWLKGTSSVNY